MQVFSALNSREKLGYFLSIVIVNDLPHVFYTNCMGGVSSILADHVILIPMTFAAC